MKKTPEELLAWLWQWGHGAWRTWEEIVGCLSGATRPADLDLPEKEAELAAYYGRLLLGLVAEGQAERQTNEDPRHDCYRPVGRAVPRSA